MLNHRKEMQHLHDSTSSPHNSLEYADWPTVDSVLEQVDQLQDAVDCDILQALEEENACLEQNVRCAEQRMTSIAKILREAFEAYVVLNAYLEQLVDDTRLIEEEWTSFIFGPSRV